MARDPNKKSSSAKYIVIFFLVIFLVAAGFFLVKFVYPEALDNFARGFANETLVTENQQLSGDLNVSQQNLANVTDDRDRLAWQLTEEKGKGFLWPVLIGLLIIGLVFIYFWHKHQQKLRGLTIDEAKALFHPRVRKTYGFNLQEYPHFPKITPFASERVDRTKNDRDEAYFFIEYEFFPRDGSGYVRGIRSNRRHVVTIALLNFRYETHRREMPGLRLSEAIEYAHRVELWGFHLQKSPREDDINKLIQDANSIKEIKKAVEDDTEAAA